MSPSRRLPGWIVPFPLVLALFPFSVTTANDVTVSIEAPDEVAEGSNFTAGVNITEVTNFDSGQFDIAYDSTAIQVIGVEMGPEGVTAGIIDSTNVSIDMWAFSPPGEPGKIRVLVNVGGIAGVNGTGYLAEIHFNVVGSPGDSSNITLSEGMLFDNMAEEIPVAQWLGGSVLVCQALSVTGCEADPNPTSVGHNTTFSANATGGVGTYTWDWDFGDGNSSAEVSPVYAYAAAGNYSVTVTVADDVGQESCSFNISVREALAVDFSADSGIVEAYPNPLIDPILAYPTSGYVAGTIITTNTTFNFTNESTGGVGPYNYEWDFGDGNNSTDENPVYTYTVNATYNVSLTVTDSLANVETETKPDYLMAYRAGDANHNGVIDMADVTKVEREILRIDSPTIWADANVDHAINMADVTTIEWLILLGG